MLPDGPVPMVGQFVEKAEHDLRAASVLAAERGLEDAVCFHCQQAVEKMLKAALLAAGAEPPRVHDLGFLLETLETLRPVPEGLRAACAALADFAVAPRYPGWEPGDETADASDALRTASAAVEMIRPLAQPRTGE